MNRPQGCGGTSPTDRSTVCITDSDTYYIETPAVVGVPWIGITSEDVGKFLSNDGESPIWQQVAYSEENFTTENKEALNELISGNYVWKETAW